jgi:hypothetical protein
VAEKKSALKTWQYNEIMKAKKYAMAKHRRNNQWQ